MTAILAPVAKQQFFTNSGEPAAGYKIYVYTANTTTPATTYQDRAGTVPNANPIILDARGEATIYLTPGTVYDFVLKTDNDALVWTREDVTASGNDATTVEWTRTEAGAVEQALADELARIVRPEHFGAVGDGSTDDTAAIRAAITAAGTGGRVTFREGKNYKITDTLTINSNFVELYSPGMLDRSAKITMAAGVDAPLIESADGTKFKINGLTLVGSSTTATPLTNQSCIKITTVNNIDIRNCVLTGAHDLVSINGVCFYLDLDNVLFQSCTRSWVYGVCAVANGIDLKMTNCRGTTSQTASYGFYFSGLGSAIVSDCQFSPSHCTVAGFMVDTVASLAGPSFFTNVVFELGATGAPGLRLKGDTTYPCKNFHFANCYFFGDAAVSIEYGVENHFSNCYFTGTNDGVGGRNAISIGTRCDNLFLDNCAFEVSNVPIVTNAAATSISMYITNPRYGGSAIFCELSNLTTAANLTAFDCRGGNVGTNAAPIKLPTENNSKAYISCIGENYGPIREQVLVGTFAAAGSVNIVHGISSGNRKVVSADVYIRGGSGQMTPMTVNYIDAANINVAGASAGIVYRAVIRFVNDVDANWPA